MRCGAMMASLSIRTRSEKALLWSADIAARYVTGVRQVRWNDAPRPRCQSRHVSGCFNSLTFGLLCAQS